MIQLNSHQKKLIGFLGIGILICLVLWGIVKLSAPSLSESQQAALETAKQEGYTQGYTDGYNTAKEENSAAYQHGYETARKEIGRGSFTMYGISGFVLGVFIGLGSVAFLTRKTLTTQFKTLRKKYELKRAFESIPPDLPQDVQVTAEQIARTYTNILEQFHSAKGYTVAQYIDQWRPKLKDLMGKSLRLMELIRELEATRTNVDEQTLDRTIVELRETARRSREDEARNAAVRSLRRARQTQQDLQQTHRNLNHCKTALQGMKRVLDSMHLKISNIKVNTQKTELLDELSSDLEREMIALEEALGEIAP